MLIVLLAAYAVLVTAFSVRLRRKCREEVSYASVGWFHSTGTIGVVRAWPMCDDCEMVYRQTHG